MFLGALPRPPPPPGCGAPWGAAAGGAAAGGCCARRVVRPASEISSASVMATVKARPGLRSITRFPPERFGSGVVEIEVRPDTPAGGGTLHFGWKFERPIDPALDAQRRFVYNYGFQFERSPLLVRKWRNWQTRKPQELVTAR